MHFVNKAQVHLYQYGEILKYWRQLILQKHFCSYLIVEDLIWQEVVWILEDVANKAKFPSPICSTSAVLIRLDVVVIKN